MIAVLYPAVFIEGRIIFRILCEAFIMISCTAPVGVFDSGVGGISVLRKLRQELPCENFIFYGDCRNAPYGEKSEARIRALSEACLRTLLDKGVKAVVIACNTATSAAADYLRKSYPDLIIIGMEPAVKPAVLYSGHPHPHVLVLATASTLKGPRIRKLRERFSASADLDFLPAPGIVRLVEADLASAPEMTDYLSGILAPYRLQPDGSIENRLQSVVLGCTHFPFAAQKIREVLGYDVVFFDGADGTSRETRRRLDEASLLNPSSAAGTLELILSSDAPEHRALAERLLLQ